MTSAAPKRRIALVTNIPAHYRLPLYRRLAGRYEADFFFTRSGERRFWSSGHRQETAGLRAIPANRPLRLALHLAVGRYDCVVIGLGGRLTLLAALAGTKLRRRPYVLWVGLWARPKTLVHRLAWPFVRSLLRDADALLVYGSHVARFVEDEIGSRDAVFEAAQAVENDRFAARVATRSSDGGLLRALFVGRLEPEKGLDVLLESLALVSAPVTLGLAGSGSLEPALREAVRRARLQRRVAFLGYTPQERLAGVYAEADVLVLPSVTTGRVRETWGRVVNEAMSAGLPVVATTAVGATAGGLVVDGETGLVVEEGDRAALARSLDRLALDATMRLRLGMNARAHVRRWSYEAAEIAFAQAIDVALAARGRA
jgi:glycosyltransferase involved in cell wall biosynthesis